MKKLLILIIPLLAVASCGKAEFINNLQGKWEATELSCIGSDTTYVFNSPNRYFTFDNYNYKSFVGDSLIESGIIYVNPKVSQITFSSDLGNVIYLIEENTESTQSWRSKKKILEFYVNYKLAKIE